MGFRLVEDWTKAVEAVLDVGSGQARVLGKLDETAVLAKERYMRSQTQKFKLLGLERYPFSAE